MKNSEIKADVEKAIRFFGEEYVKIAEDDQTVSMLVNDGCLVFGKKFEKESSEIIFPELNGAI